MSYTGNGFLSNTVRFISPNQVGGATQLFNIPQPTGAQLVPEPEDPQGDIEVDTYQIAVPNGDCSVHILAERTDTRHGQILSAILMDGGNDGSPTGVNAAKIIEDALGVIRERYDPGGPKDIRFDAWVITHWDNDHWAGSLQMLLNNKDDYGRSTRMKYAGKSPITRLYCPNWTGIPKYPAIQVAPKKDLLKTRPRALYIDGDDADDFDAKGTGMVYFKNIDPPNGYPLCTANWGHRQLLGMDFFTGDTPWKYLKQDNDKSADNARQKALKTLGDVDTVMQAAYQDYSKKYPDSCA